MSRFHGPQRGYKGAHGRTKGVMKAFRELKREEAVARNGRRIPISEQSRTKQERKTSAAETAGIEVSEAA